MVTTRDRSNRSSLALARAKRRQREAGAAMFIVAVTLGLLAAMGAYGLSATTYDVRASGHTRQAAQAQHAAEAAIMMASTTLTPGNAQVVLNRMRADRLVRTSKCSTSTPSNGVAADEARNRSAESCLVLTPETMGPLTADPTTWGTAVAVPHDYGRVQVKPFVRVELTNPIDFEAPAGYSVASTGGVRPPVFTAIRATVFVQMHDYPSGTVNGAATSLAKGRGRLVVGPYMP